MNRYDGYMEIEYAIAPRYRNNGYTVQAVKKMLGYGFKEMNLSAITLKPLLFFQHWIVFRLSVIHGNKRFDIEKLAGQRCKGFI